MKGCGARARCTLASCHGDLNAKDFADPLWISPVDPNLLVDDQKSDGATF